MFNYSEYKNFKSDYNNSSKVGYGDTNSDLDLDRYGSSDAGEEADLSEGRPLSITLIVGFQTFSLILGLVLLFIVSKSLPAYAPWLWMLSAFGNVMLVASLVGLWNMRKYGAELFVIQTLLGFLVDFFAKSQPNYLSLALTVVMTAFVFLHYKEMR